MESLVIDAVLRTVDTECINKFECQCCEHKQYEYKDNLRLSGPLLFLFVHLFSENFYFWDGLPVRIFFRVVQQSFYLVYGFVAEGMLKIIGLLMYVLLLHFQDVPQE